MWLNYTDGNPKRNVGNPTSESTVGDTLSQCPKQMYVNKPYKNKEKIKKKKIILQKLQNKYKTNNQNGYLKIYIA